MSVPITPGTGSSSVAAEIIGGLNYQQVKLVGGQAGSTSLLGITPDNALLASVIGTVRVSVVGAVPVTFAASANQSVSGTVGVSVIGTVPVTFAATSNQSVSGTVGSSIIGAVPVLIYSTPASFVSGVTSVLTGTGLTSVISAAGTNIKNYVTHVLVTNAASAGTFVDIKDGGGNVLYSGYAAGSGGGFSSHIYPPIVGSTNKSIDAQPRVQASIIVAMTGYTL